jgi:hypothetical protein
MRLFFPAGIILLTLTPAPQMPVYTNVTQDSGVLFKHSYGDHHLDNIVEGTGAGVCIFDFDNDGLADLHFATGAWTQGVSDNMGRDLRGKLSNRLYRNLGNGRFADVTAKAGVGGRGIYSSGCSAADYDNDGSVDLYVLNYGPNILYHNNGNGTFSDVTPRSGLGDPRWSLSAVWLDYNSDGWLDVYVCNYLEYDGGKYRDFYPADGYPGPLSYNGQPDILYRNNGDGTFTDVTRQAGMWRPDGRGMSASAADFNNDGRLDVWVANDAMETHYFENLGNGTFAERAMERNVAFGENGQGVSSMGPYAGDINRDGLLDCFVPNLNYCILFINEGKKGFIDRTTATGLSQLLGQYAGWAGIMLDYDNDGWLDLFITHGNAHHEFVQEDSLIRNKGNGAFEDVSRRSGRYFFEKYVGRGAAWGDLDNDGDVDLVIVNLNDNAKILRNDGGNLRRWLQVEPRLRFPSGSRLAIGARVTVTAGGLRQIEDVNPVRGYLSQGDWRLHFGLGGAEHADVEIRWPDGVVERFPRVRADQLIKYTHEAKAARVTDGARQ